MKRWCAAHDDSVCGPLSTSPDWNFRLACGRIGGVDFRAVNGRDRLPPVWHPFFFCNSNLSGVCFAF